MVLPDGFLFGDGVTTRVKEQLFRECDVHTIVRIPSSAFAPYTDIATNLVFFTKGRPTRETWYFEHRIPKTLKAYSKTNPIRSSEFEPERGWWNERSETENAWRVSADLIRARDYNLDIVNPHQPLANVRDDERDTRSELAKIDKSIDSIVSGIQSLVLPEISNQPSGHDLFVRNLGAELELPGATSRIRNLVLFGAYRGLLSQAQDGEKSGDEILQSLRATLSKNSLKLLTNGVRLSEEPTYALPVRWVWARFAEVAEIASNLVNPAYHPDAIHIAPDNIEKHTGRLLICRTVAEDSVTSSNHQFTEGQILYSKIRPNLSKAVRVSCSGLCSADMYPITPRLDAGYLHGFMLSQTFVASVSALANRLAMPKVNQKQLANVLVPVAPESEQKQIASILDQVFRWLHELDELLGIRARLRLVLSDSLLFDFQGEWVSRAVL